MRVRVAETNNRGLLCIVDLDLFSQLLHKFIPCINVKCSRVGQASQDGDAAAAESVRSNGHEVDVIATYV